MTFTKYYYYTLTNPTTHEIGYVGYTTDRRFDQVSRAHIEAAVRNKQENPPLEEWIREQMNTTKGLYIDLLETTAFATQSEAQIRLDYWNNEVLGKIDLSLVYGDDEDIHEDEDTEQTKISYQELAEMRKSGKNWKTIQEYVGMTRAEFTKIRPAIEELLV